MAWMGMSIRPPGARAADFDAGACRARPPATFVFNSDRKEPATMVKSARLRCFAIVNDYAKLRQNDEVTAFRSRSVIIMQPIVPLTRVAYWWRPIPFLGFPTSKEKLCGGRPPERSPPGRPLSGWS